MVNETVISRSAPKPKKRKLGIVPVYRRFIRFHKRVFKVHVRNYQWLKGYKFAYVVLVLPPLSLASTLIVANVFLGFWAIATITWLSLAWRVPRPRDDPEDGAPKSKPWWPNYSWPIAIGLILCVALMAAPMSLLLFVQYLKLDKTIVAMGLGLLVEVVGVGLILSFVYYFLIGYMVGVLRTALFLNPMSKRYVTRASFFLTVVLLPLAVATLLEVNFENTNEWIRPVVILSLPLIFFQTPWSGKSGAYFGSIIPHIQLISFGSAFAVLSLGDFAGFYLAGIFTYIELENFVLLTKVPEWIFVFGSIEEERVVIFGSTLFLFVLITLIRLRGDVVDIQLGQSEAAALSIHSDARTYVDRDYNARDLLKYILKSKSGVIGITGVRGAGKTALLKRVLSGFDRRYRVVWMTAPVSHQEGFAFLTSVCRTVCRQTIDDTEKVLYGQTRAWQLAFGEFFRRSSGFLSILLVVFVAIWWVHPAGGNGYSFFSASSALPTPPLVRIGTEIVESSGLQIAELDTAFQRVVAAERRAIAGLVVKIDNELKERETMPDSAGREMLAAVVPIGTQTGFDLIRVLSEESGRKQLKRRHDWLPEWVRDPEVWLSRSEREQWRRGPHMIASKQNIAFLEVFANYWGAVYFDLEIPRVRRFLRLQESFYHHVLGEWEDPIQSGSNLRFPQFNPDFRNTVSALQMFRGHPALESHLEPEIEKLRELLGVTESITKDSSDPDLASITIFSAYYQALKVTGSGDKQTYFLNQFRLQELRNILARYIDLLDGKALNKLDAGLPNSFTSADKTLVSIWRSYGPTIILLWPLWLALLVLALGRTAWRFGNFVIRGSLNYKLLTLAAASERFLEFLDYSEGREASRGLSIRGISFGAKRTLLSRKLTLQSLTDKYLDYVRTLLRYYNGKLIVVIDELDKVTDPQQVRDLLLEMKGALFEDGCYYLISISEDAASAFRGRLSEGRDIFESSFDDIITLRRMAPETARELVRRRLRTALNPPEITDEAVDVLTMFAGAIPREIVRHLRDSVIADSHNRKITPSDSGLQILRSEVEKWLTQIGDAPFGGSDLVELRNNCGAIVAQLEGLTVGRTWPVEINGLLLKNLTILDPRGERQSMDLASNRQTLVEMGGTAENIEDAKKKQELRTQIRRIAEVQTCIRLLIMNTVMTYVWPTPRRKWQHVVPEVIDCLRLVMQQPALAESQLDGIKKSLDSAESDKLPSSTATPLLDTAPSAE